MKIQEIEVPSNVKYLNEFLTDLPCNVMANKTLVGCGATTICLTNDVPYVLCLPFKALVHSKISSAKHYGIETIACFGDNKTWKKDILTFTGKKILVTYDSLSELVKLIDTSKYKILIDESHLLVNAGAFRPGAVNSVLENYKRFKSFVFCTATPIKNQYQLKELQDIDTVVYKWSNVEDVKIKYQYIDKTNPHHVYNSIGMFCLDHLLGKIDGNMHIFINSVKSIVEILNVLRKLTTVSPSQVSISIANTSDNKKMLNERCKAFSQIYQANTRVTKINFYTGGNFEGIDISDPTGKTYIITCGDINHSHIDISTTLPQIIGRVRDSIYKNEITLIYNKSSDFGRYINPETVGKIVTQNQLLEAEYNFIQFLEADLKKQESYIELYNTGKLNGPVEFFIKGASESRYFTVEKLPKGTPAEVLPEIKLNECVFRAEMQAWESLNNPYKIHTNKNVGSISKSTINRINYEHLSIPLYDLTNMPEKKPFQQSVLDYLKFVNNPDLDPENEREKYMNWIEINYPIIKPCLEIFGEDVFKANRYTQVALQDKLNIYNKLSENELIIINKLNLVKGSFYSSNQLVEKLSKIYEELNIDITPKSSDIERFGYNITKSTSRLEEDKSKVIGGYKILDIVMSKMALRRRKLQETALPIKLTTDKEIELMVNEMQKSK